MTGLRGQRKDAAPTFAQLDRGLQPPAGRMPILALARVELAMAWMNSSQRQHERAKPYIDVKVANQDIISRVLDLATKGS